MSKVNLNQLKKSVFTMKNYVDTNKPRKISEEIIFSATAEQVQAGMQYATDNPDKVSWENCIFEMDINHTFPEVEAVYLEYQGNEFFSHFYASDNNMIKFFTFSSIDDDYDDTWTMPEGELLCYMYIGKDINKQDNPNKCLVRLWTPTTNITDFTLKTKNKAVIDNELFDDDVKFNNSISMNRAKNTNIGPFSVALGEHAEAPYHWSIALGNDVHARGQAAASIGQQNISQGTASVTMGWGNRALSNYSYAQGRSNLASAAYTNATGYKTKATNSYSKSSGVSTTASGSASTAEGNGSVASGANSHAEGYGTIAKGQNQHAEGKYNIEDTANKYAHIVGNGSSSSARSNAHTLDWNGNTWYQGNVYIGGTGQDDTNAKKLATEKYVDDNRVTKTSELINDSGFLTEHQDLSNYATSESIGNRIQLLPTNISNISSTLNTDIRSNTISEAFPIILEGNYNTILTGYKTLIVDGASKSHLLDSYSHILVNIYDKNSNIISSKYLTNGTASYVYINLNKEKIYCQFNLDKKYDENNNLIDDDHSLAMQLRILKPNNTEEFINKIKDLKIEVKVCAPNYLGVNNAIVYTPTNDYHPATKKYVDDAKASIVVPTKTSELTNDSGFLTSIPDEYITEDELTAKNYIDNTTLESKGYLTEHQDLSGYAPIDSPNFTNAISMGRLSSSTIGKKSTALGNYVQATADCSHAEGQGSIARGNYSHAEGSGALSEGIGSHAENTATARGDYSHAEGSGEAIGVKSHAEGNQSKANAEGSHAEGYNTLASGQYQHVQGKYNVEDTTGTYAHIIGNGTGSSARSNAHTVDWNGNAWYKGDVYIGGTNQETNAKKLATEDYVNNKVSGLVDSAPETLDTLKELATALGNDPNFATTITNQIGNKVDKVNGKGLSTNDLTDALKSNYDTAYTHSQSAHAPSNAQKNSDITKAEIEAKLTGDITTHTHSQYLTSIPSEYITEQELTSKGYITEAVLTSKGYATESQINSAVEAAATTDEEVKTTVNQILGGDYIE